MFCDLFGCFKTCYCRILTEDATNCYGNRPIDQICQTGRCSSLRRIQEILYYLYIYYLYFLLHTSINACSSRHVFAVQQGAVILVWMRSYPRSLNRTFLWVKLQSTRSCLQSTLWKLHRVASGFRGPYWNVIWLNPLTKSSQTDESGEKLPTSRWEKQCVNHEGFPPRQVACSMPRWRA